MKEDEIIRLVASRLYGEGENPLYPGDDSFVVDLKEGRYVITCDQYIEGVHFGGDYFTYQEMAVRAVYATVSDICAMGAKPQFYMLCLGLPPNVDMDVVEQIAEGLYRAQEALNIKCIAGDTTSSKSVNLSVFCFGISEGRVLQRSRVNVNDDIYISGEIGLSYVGLELLKGGLNRKSAEAERWGRAIERHITPLPRVELGLSLAERGIANACIDTSDSLSICLHHLSASSGVGIEIDRDTLPISSELIRFSEMKDFDLLEVALYAGEDYELLFTTSNSKSEEIDNLSRKLGIRLTRVGRAFEGEGVYLIGMGERLKIEAKGFSHFGR